MNRIVTAGAVALLASTVSGAAIAEKYAAALPIPPTHPLTVAYGTWAEEIAKETNNEITFEIFSGASLYPPQAGLQSTADGLSQVAFVVANYTPSELPHTASLGDVGFAHPDFFALMAAMSDFLINDPQTNAEYQNQGVVPLSGFSTPEYFFICNTPIASLADFQGKKIRTPTSGFGRLAAHLGAVSVSIPSSEIFTAFDRGALDCTTGDPSFLTGSVQILDVVNTLVMMPLSPSYTSSYHTFDHDFWRGLTDDQRRIVLNATARALAHGHHLYMIEAEKGLKAARERNFNMPEATDEMKAALASFLDANKQAQIDSATSLGVQNAADLLARFEATVVKWEGLLAGVDRADEEAVAKILRDNIYDKVDVATYGVK